MTVSGKCGMMSSFLMMFACLFAAAQDEGNIRNEHIKKGLHENLWVN